MHKVRQQTGDSARIQDRADESLNQDSGSGNAEHNTDERGGKEKLSLICFLLDVEGF
jgi:hypothetical protein